MDIDELKDKALWLRQELWDMVIRQGKGHIPSSYSCVEIIVALYYGGVARVIRGQPEALNRDRVVVSKGHAAMVQYPILADFDFFDKLELERFTQPGGLLGMYADFNVPGIEGVSGSLGHGLGMGSGFALAAKKNGENYRTFVILGDGECYEGSVWESAMFAAHHELDNLVVIVDRNELCVMGKTEDLLALGDLGAKWRSFGWETITVDGHSFEELLDAFSELFIAGGRPLSIIANTVKGKGVSFMEGRPEWHNKMPNDEQIKTARVELGLKPFLEA